MGLFKKKKSLVDLVTKTLRVGELMDTIETNTRDLTQFLVPYHMRNLVKRRLRDTIDLYRVLTGQEYPLPAEARVALQLEDSTQAKPEIHEHPHSRDNTISQTPYVPHRSHRVNYRRYLRSELRYVNKI